MLFPRFQRSMGRTHRVSIRPSPRQGSPITAIMHVLIISSKRVISPCLTLNAATQGICAYSAKNTGENTTHVAHGVSLQKGARATLGHSKRA